MGKRICSLFLTIVMITLMIPVIATSAQDQIIINQVYGGGGKSDTPVTHSFIELYNPTNSSVNLTGFSIQYASNRGGDHLGNTGNVWIVKNLSGSIPAKHSFLIRGAQEVTSAGLIKFAVNTYDLDFPDLIIDNKQYRVALVSTTMPLAMDSWNEMDGTIVDFVSAKDSASTNEPFGEGNTSKTGISKQYAIRRNNFNDTDHNANDFALVDYRIADINTVRPRSLIDGSILSSHIMINQVYGGGGKSDTPITHSFIELYNPTNLPVDLTGWSIQYASNRGGDHLGNTGNIWIVKSLSGIVPPKQSFLIRGAQEVTSAGLIKFAINTYDLDFPDLIIDNKQYRVALVSSASALTMDSWNPSDSTIIDFVSIKDSALTNEPTGEGNTSKTGVSKQYSARRSHFIDTDINADDFTLIDYRIANIVSVYPRSLTDGSWGSITPKSPIFSQDGGMFTQAFNLSLTSSDGVSIYYTLDGSLPFSNGILSPSAILYTGPISIEKKEAPYSSGDISMIQNICPAGSWKDPQGELFKGTVVKAVAMNEVGGEKYPSSTVVNSYFVSEDIFDMYQLPVISLTMNNEDLFSESKGIYHNYNATGGEWERPGYIEFYEPDGTLGFKRGIGMRIHGGHSRAFQQKSLRIYFKSGYDESGESSITYPLLPGNKKRMDNTTELNNYKRFVLRASSNDINASMFRDALAHKINTGLNAYGSNYRPSVVFINGEFWGLYNIREHYSDDYLETHFGVNKNNNDLMFMEYEGNKIPIADNPGDEREYIEFLIRLGAQSYKDLPEYDDIYAEVGDIVPDMNDPSVYEYVKQNIDIDNFIDYNIAHIFFANIDWPFNNVKMWRVKNPTGAMPSTWQFMMHDLDFGFGLIDNNYQTDTFSFAFGANRYQFYNPDWSTFLLERLKENEDFRNRFVNRFATLLSTYYASNRTVPMVDESKDIIQESLTEQRKRNVAAILDATIPYTDEQITNKWMNDVAVVREFLLKRPQFVNQYMTSFFGLENSELTLKTNLTSGYMKIGGVDINENTPGVQNPSVFSAKYFKNVPVQISAIEKEGYDFSRFEVRQGNEVRVYHEKTISINPTSDTVEVVARFVQEGDSTQKENTVAAGNNGILSIMNDGELYYYQNGTNQKIMDDAKAVWASGQYFFAKKNDNRFYVWGNDLTTPWYLGNDIIAATAGNDIAYLKTDHKAYLLGQSIPFAENVQKIVALGEDYYYLSNDTVYKKGTPAPIKAGISDIAVNNDGLFMLSIGGTLYKDSSVLMNQVDRISAGMGHLLAQGTDGNLYGIGSNSSKQLEDSDVPYITTLKQISKRPVCFSAGGNYTVIEDNDGIVVMGGNNYPIGMSKPIKRPPLSLITAGETHVTYTLGGKVYSWGGNDLAQLGNGLNRTDSSTKKELYIYGSGFTLNNAVGVSAGLKQGLAIGQDGKLIAWGNGESYNLTRGSTISFVDGAIIAQNANFVVSGKNHTMYVSDSNILYGAGSNEKGKIGWTADFTTTFKQIMSNVYVAGAGMSHSVILDLDGKLYGLGDNTYGQLGAGAVQFNTPTPILNDVKMAWAAYDMTLVLKNDGSLWGMGNAPMGQFATGGATTGSTLIHIADDVKSASVSNTHILVLKEDGSLWSAGSNNYGELKLGSTDSAMHTLTKIMENIAYIAAGSGFSAVMAEDGAVYTWGKNDRGQLGCGNINPTLDTKKPINAGILSLGGGNYTNQALEIVTDLSASRFVMAEINVTSGRASAKKMQAMIATYDANDRLLSLGIERISAKGNGSTTLKINTYIHNQNAAKLKVMLWDGDKELSPLFTMPAL